jgi:hypothetical protein
VPTSGVPVASVPRRRLLVWFTLGSGALLVILLLAIASWVPFSSEALRARVVATLADQLDADVDLQALTLRVFPRFHAEGVGLTIRHDRRRDVPPLISVRRLTVDADLIGLVRKHVALVTLDGLDIEIPPGHDDGGKGEDQPAQADRPAASQDGRPDSNRPGRDVVIDRLVANDAQLAILPGEPSKRPKIWVIHALTMRTVGFDRGMPFDATLTNAIPPGEIATKGIFGPWRAADPGATPLDGTFTFARADLSIFKGISGILSAHGEFGGPLGRLGIHGETDTPDFTVTVSGHPVALHTDYHATVDGTNGDTRLDRIDATFLNTSLTAKGSVIDAPGAEGRTVTLDITMQKARVEDVMRLAVKASKPPMSGALTMTTKFVLPPGDRDVVDKLRLDGEFSIATARFTDIDIQQKVNELSKRSRGMPEESARPSVASNFKGRFRLGNGALAIRALTFEMPGTVVQLAGVYKLKAEWLDFTGTLLMDAKISDTQTGWKHLLLKVVDPLFSKQGGGSRIPIKIAGKRSDPSFGLDKSRIFHRSQ